MCFFPTQNPTYCQVFGVFSGGRAGGYHPKDLNGKPCWILPDGNNSPGNLRCLRTWRCFFNLTRVVVMSSDRSVPLAQLVPWRKDAVAGTCCALLRGLTAGIYRSASHHGFLK